MPKQTHADSPAIVAARGDLERIAEAMREIKHEFVATISRLEATDDPAGEKRSVEVFAAGWMGATVERLDEIIEELIDDAGVNFGQELDEAVEEQRLSVERVEVPNA